MDTNDRLVIYTGLFGAYDSLVEPPEKFANCDFICFTDDANLVSDVWDVRVVADVSDPIYANREVKFFPHKYLSQYKFSLYIDSNIKIINNPYELAINYLNINNICIPRHFERNCIYQEINECLKLKKITNEDSRYLRNALELDSFPHEYGLCENNIILRNHNDDSVIHLMEKWWSFFMEGPKRDQLSLVYLSWKYNVPIKIIKESSRNKNKYFRYELHLAEKKLPFFKRSLLWVRANRERHLIYKIIHNIKVLFFKR